MSTADLAAWLTAVWDEEEEAMKRVGVGERIWFVCDDGHVEEPRREDGPPFGSGEYERWDDGEYRLPTHHNTWLPALDPASVLARIAADRKILAEHRAEEVVSIEPETRGRAFLVCRRCRSGERQLVWPCTTVRLKAEQYATRPDAPEWLVERQGVER